MNDTVRFIIDIATLIVIYFLGFATGCLYDWWKYNHHKYIDNNDKPFKVITLCGSTKFKDKFLEVQKALTITGHIVITPGEYSKAEGEELPEETLKMFKELHKQKIDMADAIFVINYNGYIGESTKEEIEYAKSQNKIIMYLEENDEEKI